MFSVTKNAMKTKVKLDLAVYEQVISLDLCKTLRCYITSNFKNKKTYDFFVYDYILANKDKNLEITKTSLMFLEGKKVLEKNKNYLLLYLGSDINSQTNGALINFSKVDYADANAILQITENKEDNLENHFKTCHVHLTGIINVSNNTQKVWLNFSDPAQKHCFAVMEYKDHGEDLTYFPGENEFFPFLISKPTRTNHFPAVDFPSSVYK